MNFGNKRTLEDLLVIFRRKYVRPQSQATANHKWPEINFETNTKLLSHFLQELNECAEQDFGPLAQQMIDSFFYCKFAATPLTLNNLSFFENGTYKHIVADLEKTFKLSGFQTAGELPVPRMATTTTTVNKETQPENAEQQQIICRFCKKPGLVIKMLGTHS